MAFVGCSNRYCCWERHKHIISLFVLCTSGCHPARGYYLLQTAAIHGTCARELDCFGLLYCVLTLSIPLSFFFHLSSRTPSPPFKMWYSCYRKPRCLARALFHFFSLTELATRGMANLSHHQGRTQVQNVVMKENRVARNTHC